MKATERINSLLTTLIEAAMIGETKARRDKKLWFGNMHDQLMDRITSLDDKGINLTAQRLIEIANYKGDTDE